MLGCSGMCRGVQWYTGDLKQLFLRFSGSNCETWASVPSLEGGGRAMCLLSCNSVTFKAYSRICFSSTPKHLCHDSGLQKSGTQSCVYAKVLTHSGGLASVEGCTCYCQLLANRSSAGASTASILNLPFIKCHNFMQNSASPQCLAI